MEFDEAAIAVKRKPLFAGLIVALHLVLAGCGVPSTDGQRDNVATGAWRNLIEDAELRDWRLFNGGRAVTPAWAVEEDILLFRPQRKLGDRPLDIITVAQFEDFDLRLEWRVSEGGNSGVFFHVTEHEGLTRASHSGIEMQVLDDEGHKDGQDPKKRAGAAYDLYAPRTTAVRPAGQWNAVRILSVGGRVAYWLNGVDILSFDRDSEDWHHRLSASKHTRFPHFAKVRRGHIGLQDHGDPVAFRNIRIRCL